MKTIFEYNRCVELLRYNPDLLVNYMNIPSVSSSRNILNHKDISFNNFINSSINAVACPKETKDILLHHSVHSEPLYYQQRPSLAWRPACWPQPHWSWMICTWKCSIKGIPMTFNWCNLSVLNWVARFQSRKPTQLMAAWSQHTPLSPIHHPPYFPLLIRSTLTRMIINGDIYMHSPPCRWRNYEKKEGPISKGSSLLVVGSIYMENECKCVHGKCGKTRIRE